MRLLDAWRQTQHDDAPEPTDGRYRLGDVLTAYSGGRHRYVRVGDLAWEDVGSDRTYVQDCDGAGFLLNGTGRYLRTTTLDSRYRLHYRANDHDAQPRTHKPQEAAQ